MKVLVSGGTGWIGRATCASLQRHGHEGISFDTTHDQDIRDRDAVFDQVKEADHVIHLAGVLGTHELFDSPNAAVEVNVLGGLNVVLGCVEFDKGLTEITMPRVNPSLYAATKACAMDIALAYVEAKKLRASFVRAYNAFGPGQAYGGDHPQKIIPTFASKAWAGEKIPVWGNGQLLTDLVHVDDVAEMLVRAMEFGEGQVFDAGTGKAQKVIDVALDVLKIVGREDDLQCYRYENVIDWLPPRVGERWKSTEADVSRGENWGLLGGWHPLFDPFQFRQAVESYRP